MEELRRMREQAGLTQVDLAKVSGVDRGTIIKIESGKRSPSIETLEKLARAMGAEIGDFFPKAQAPLPLLDERDAGLSEGWTQAYADVGRELLRGWERQDLKWGRFLESFVNSLPEERRVTVPLSRLLLTEYLDWIIDTGGVINAYVEGVLGKHAAGMNPDLDEVCDQMLRLWTRISSHGRALSRSVAGKDDPEVARFREQLEAQGARDFETRYREAARTQDAR